ncbi:ATP-binding protein [Thalassospira alkalitolerans]|uniref:Helicase HerA central domain-containing protein n=1 Tax=Thalassospira alkalitolerans TaxID=1293890 RepID=A0A1Y2LAF6_9PROT|nr:DUF87 domain-containing protein [Thalassospira alkalitolerans]OSQ45314.1 hypothetical protein TALK_17770 [Thalassospira alkalitolerans]
MLSYAAGLHVGTVEASSSVEIKVLLERNTPQDIAFNTSQPQAFPRVNGFILVPNEGGTVVAVISRMNMEPELPSASNAGEVPLPSSRRRLYATPIGTIELSMKSGTGEYRLLRGVDSFPTVGDTVILPTLDQLKAIVEASGDDKRVKIGLSPIASGAPVTVDPDKLFGRHLGVFGNTGSGKSCTVSGLIRWSIEAAKMQIGAGESVQARFIVLDPNGEYRSCFNDLADKVDVKVFSVEPDVHNNESDLTVPAWFWNGEEWASILNAAPGTQRPVLMNALRHLRSAGMAALEGGDEDGQLLLASSLSAFCDYLRSCRAAGVQALGNFPQFITLRRNLEGIRDQLDGAQIVLGMGNLALSADIQSGVDVIAAVIQECTNQQGYPQVFHDLQIARILEALGSILDRLPRAAIVSGASEDMPSYFDLGALPDMINYLASVMPGNFSQNMAGLDLRVRSLLSDSRISTVIAPEEGRRSFPEWLEGLFGNGDAGKGRITVLDLSLVPSDVLTTIVSVLSRLIFETAQRYRRDMGSIFPTVLVLEEAHNFVQRSYGDVTENASMARCRKVFEKIAKEGRKFGVGLVLSSQRPAELAPTVIAQCNSFILHRIVNDRDQDLVSRLAPDSAAILLKELPSLPSRKAILLGISTELPTVFDVLPIDAEQRPNSSNPDFWDVWTKKRQVGIDFDKIAENWSS